MLLMLLIGWAVVLPIAVVAGLLAASNVLGRRARRAGSIDVTGLARELSRLEGAEAPAARTAPSAAATTVAIERQPVGV